MGVVALALQHLGEELVDVAAQGEPEELLLPETEGDHLRQVLQVEIIAFPQRALQLVHADAAVVAVLPPEVDEENAVAPDGRGEHGHLPGLEGGEVLPVDAEFVDQLQRDHFPAGAGLDFPVEHSLHPPGTGEDVEVGVMDEHGVFKDVPADGEHLLQRLFVLHGPVERLVPESVFFKDFLEQVVGPLGRNVGENAQDRAGEGKIVEIHLAGDHKIDVLPGAEVTSQIGLGQKVHILPGERRGGIVEPDAPEPRLVGAAVKADGNMVCLQFVG